MFCKSCGNRIEEGMLFCTKCGAPVNQVPGSEQSSPNYYNNAFDGAEAVKPVAPSRSKLQLIAMIVSIVTLACISISFLISLFTGWYYVNFEVIFFKILSGIMLASAIILMISRIKNVALDTKQMAIAFTIYTAFYFIYFIYNIFDSYLVSYSLFFAIIFVGTTVVYWLALSGKIKKQYSDQLLSLGVAIILLSNITSSIVVVFSGNGLLQSLGSLSEVGFLAVFALLIIGDKNMLTFLRKK